MSGVIGAQTRTFNVWLASYPEAVIKMIWIIEHARLSHCIYDALERRFGSDSCSWRESQASPTDDDLVIDAIDARDIFYLERATNNAIRAGYNFVSLHVHAGEIIIGPYTARGIRGCISCWASRFYAGRPLAGRFYRSSADTADPARVRDGSINIVALRTISEVFAERISQVYPMVTRPLWGSIHSEVYLWNGRTLTGGCNRFMWDSLCPTCGEMIIDCAEDAIVEINTRTKSHEKSDRLVDIKEIQVRLDEYHIGRRGSVVSRITNSWQLQHGAVATGEVKLREDGDIEKTSGFSDRYSSARTMAALESLERHASLKPRTRQTSVFGTVSNLRGTAVDPLQFGLYSTEQYEANSDLLTPYSENLELSFVWGYSFGTRRAVLVPRQLGYYSLGVIDEPRFVIEGSNGCALGSCAEEAILHGIFETVERDAFLLTWYARLNRPHVDLDQVSDPEVRYRLRTLEDQGYSVSAVDITNDMGIPALWLMAYHNQPILPYAVCIGAANNRPLSALRKAARELNAVIDRFTLELKDPVLSRRVHWLAEDPNNVRSLNDHGLFYCAPKSREHLEFLFESRYVTSIEEMEDRSRDLISDDLGAELMLTINRILRRGSDVVVVNQTSYEQSCLGLNTYKVFVTGAMPISWGQHLRRLEGLVRLPAALSTESKTSQDHPARVNDAPHPFL